MVSRRQHRTQTLLALNAAAVAAIEAHGPDVPLEDIAERAGVARRTIYRWAPGRDDLLFVHPRLWLDVFDTAATAAADEPFARRIRVACQAVCESIDADPEPVRRSMQLVLEHPQLLRGYAAVNNEWIERIAAEVQRDTDTDTAGRLRARAIGAAIMGVIDAALQEWALEGAAGPIDHLVADGLGYLDPLLTDI